MIECNISFIANWYFGKDYMAIASNVLQKDMQRDPHETEFWKSGNETY